MTDQALDLEMTPFAKRLRFFAKKLRSLYTENKLLLIGTVFVVSFLIGIWGFGLYLQGKGASFGDILYKTLQLIALNDNTIEFNSANWQLEFSRVALPGTVAWFVIEGIVLTLVRQFNLFRLTRLKDHYIICGLGSKGSVIANELINSSEGKRKKKVVALDIDESIDEKNEHISALKEAGVIVFVANALDYEWLEKLKPGKAKQIFVMTGNDEINLAIAEKVSTLVELSQRGKSTTSHAAQVITNIHSPFIWKLTKYNMPKRKDSDTVNVYDLNARIALNEIISTEELKRKTTVKVSIFGFGWLVQSLVLNLSRQVYMKGLVINVIDGAAKNHEKEFFRQYPFLSPNTHQEFYLGERIFPQINFYEREIKQLQYEEMKQHIGDDVIFFGLDDDLLEIELAMQIRQMQRTGGYESGKNIVYISKSTSLVDQFTNTHTNLGIKILYLHEGIRPLTQDHEEIEQEARKAHEQYMKTTGDARKYEDLSLIYQDDNKAQTDFWKNYTTWYGMDDQDLRSLNIEELAALEHKRWVSYRVLSGEQFGCAEGCRGQCKNGLVTKNESEGGCKKVESKNLHPCLVPYEMLCDFHKESDRNVVRRHLGLVPEA